MSVFDLLLAQAVMEGLAREAAREKLPENVFVLQRNSGSWQAVKGLCEKDNHVIAVEVTEDTSPNCLRMQKVFVNLAREFGGIGFFRASIEDGFTFAELRKDLGGVEYTPTFIFVLFHDTGISRCKYEGVAEIIEGVEKGAMHAVIKELLERKRKLKIGKQLAEELAGGLAEAMARRAAERERKLKEEYEEKSRREVAQREEQRRREEAEKKRKEEEEQRAKEDARRREEEARRREEEVRRQNRPQAVEELLGIDVEVAPVRVTKEVMAKLGISTTDCLNREDLKRKLMDSVPEYRQAQQPRGPQQTTQRTTTYADVPDRRGSSVPDEKQQTRRLEMRAEAAERNVEELEQQRQQLEQELGDARRRMSQCEAENTSLKARLPTRAVSAGSPEQQRRQEEELQKMGQCVEEKDKVITSLKGQLMRMTDRANAAEGQVLKVADRANVTESQMLKTADSTKKLDLPVEPTRVRQLELELLETRMLYTTSLENYEVLGVIHDNKHEGIVLRVKCTKNGIPSPDRVYAMKVLPSYHQQSSTVSNLQKAYRNEYQILCQLPPHENIIHLYAFFYDRADPALCPSFTGLGPNVRSLSLFLLLEELPVSMKAHVDSLIANRGPQVGDVLRWCEDLLRGLVFLESHCVAHRDLKMDNLLLSRNGKVVIADFGKAIILNDKMETPYMHGLDIGGNEAHLGPEILNARPGPNRILSYLKQPVWSAGVLAYELAGHRNPFEAGHLDQRAYEVRNVPPLEYTFCAAAVHCQRLPQKFSSLVQSMLAPDPGSRPTLADALRRMLTQ